MKSNDKKQIHEASVGELAKKVTELRTQIAGEISKRMTSNVKNVKSVKILRQKLAVVMTELRAKTLMQERSNV